MEKERNQRQLIIDQCCIRNQSSHPHGVDGETMKTMAPWHRDPGVIGMKQRFTNRVVIRDAVYGEICRARI